MRHYGSILIETQFNFKTLNFSFLRFNVSEFENHVVLRLKNKWLMIKIKKRERRHWKRVNWITKRNTNQISATGNVFAIEEKKVWEYGVFGRIVWELLFRVFLNFLKYVWMKICVKMCVMLFKMWKLLFKLNDQTVPKSL